MRHKLNIVFIVFIVFYYTSIISQNQKQIDSLKTLISSLPDDSIKIQAINELANIYVDINPEQTIEYCKEAFRIAEKRDYLIIKQQLQII
jgi:preprotein translocase subunit YajC